MQAINDSSVKNLNEFIEVLFEKAKSLKEDKLWFRGENSDRYDLVPNLYRIANKELTYCRHIDASEYYTLEQNIDSSFYRKSFNYFSSQGIENNRWNRYFLKQHYGIKTRLLDWSENAHYALFFSLRNNCDKKINARFWILSPFSLNNFSINNLTTNKSNYKMILALPDFESTDELFNNRNKLSLAGLGRKYYYMKKTGEEKLYPLAIYPPHLDSRMSAQQSCFTLFGDVVKGLEINDSNEKILDFIDINSDSKEKILQELNLIGVTSYSVFPDLDGLGKEVNNSFAKDIENTQNNSNLTGFFQGA